MQAATHAGLLVSKLIRDERRARLGLLLGVIIHTSEVRGKWAQPMSIWPSTNRSLAGLVWLDQPTAPF